MTASTPSQWPARPGAPDPAGPNRPFWDALAEGRFLLQHDAARGRYRFFPRSVQATDGHPLPWREARGGGTLVAHTLARVPAEGFEACAPYLLALVQLDEGPRVFAPLTGIEPGQARIGLRVALRVASAKAPEAGVGAAPYFFEVAA